MPLQEPRRRTSGKAVAAFAVGAASLALWFLLVPALVALVLGLAARRDIARSSGVVRGKGLASWGIALAATSLIIMAILILFFLGAIEGRIGA